jgi:hypothetical protein
VFILQEIGTETFRNAGHEVEAFRSNTEKLTSLHYQVLPMTFRSYQNLCGGYLQLSPDTASEQGSRNLLLRFHRSTAANDVTGLNTTTDFVYGNNQSAGAASKLTAFLHSLLFRCCGFFSRRCLFCLCCHSHLLLMFISFTPCGLCRGSLFCHSGLSRIFLAIPNSPEGFPASGNDNETKYPISYGRPCGLCRRVLNFSGLL